MPVLCFFALIITGIIFIITAFNCYTVKRVRLIIGIILVLLAIATIVFTFQMEIKIAERGTHVTSEKTTEYELVSLQRDTEISGTATRFYLEVSEKTVFHFYYKTTKNGKEGFSPKTISSTDVFIDETYESPPMVLEIVTTYDYHFTEFEKWWLQDYIALEPYSKTSYEIYVPEGSIVESYELYIPENSTFNYEQ